MVMDIEAAAIFFVGSILIGGGVVVAALVVLLLNNLFAQYWKPIPMWTLPQYRFVDVPHPEKEKIEPKV
jgi:hypothetical protein